MSSNNQSLAMQRIAKLVVEVHQQVVDHHAGVSEAV